MKPKRKATPRQTSDRVSSAAARVLTMIQDGAVFEWYVFEKGKYQDGTHLVKMLAASCLNQDQTKGKRK